METYMDEQKIVKELNEMDDMEQIKQFREKCKEYDWKIHFAIKNVANKMKHRDIRNFHCNIMDNYVKQVKRTEIMDKLGNKIKRWEIYVNNQRIYGNYGDIIFLMIKSLGE